MGSPSIDSPSSTPPPWAVFPKIMRRKFYFPLITLLIKINFGWDNREGRGELCLVLFFLKN
jgi:hypothetical protein